MNVYLLQGIVEAVVEVEAIDSTSKPPFDVYVFVDNVQFYPIIDGPTYGHVPNPVDNIRNTFPGIQRIQDYFWESEVRDEVERYRVAQLEDIITKFSVLQLSLAGTKEVRNTIDVIVTQEGFPPNLPNLDPSPNLATFSYDCVPICKPSLQL